ncbi:uncharacterized protein LOC125263448 [Megalobrama amblycephala]|uniref:uncharacterized protein LOC125263448 n=1 Tax=Megalobrama amblycephala TaxID=75352 RepID=UPI0020140149|nr:uncharacterized protein LOC125263448 [Megalobrama amblycephala]
MRASALSSPGELNSPLREPLQRRRELLPGKLLPGGEGFSRRSAKSDVKSLLKERELKSYGNIIPAHFVRFVACFVKELLLSPAHTNNCPSSAATPTTTTTTTTTTTKLPSASNSSSDPTSSDPGSSDSHIVPISAASAGFLLIVAALVIFFIYRKHRKTDQQVEAREEEVTYADTTFVKRKAPSVKQEEDVVYAGIVTRR